MDRAWVDELLKLLGARYKTGATAGDAVELAYRAGRAEFRPSRFVVGGGASGRDLELTVDVRIPKDGEGPEGGDRLIAAFEAKTAKPRGFERTSETSASMTSESGHESGTVRTLRYQRADVIAAEAAKQIRAIVESIDIPFTVGIHDPEHLDARDPPPPRAKKIAHAAAPMDLWEYQLDGGLLRSLTLIVDPNDRTLRVVERRFVTKKPVGETLRLAQVAKFAIRRRGSGADVIAIRKDGGELTLATGSGSADFVATMGRLAKKVFIPLEGPA
jgi:hypothetical protein